MKRASLLLLAALSACSNPAPYVTTVGILKPGQTLAVRIAAGTLNAYQPQAGQRRDLFTIAALATGKGTPPPPPRMQPTARGIVVLSTAALNSLLVRVPYRVDLMVESRRGDVNVTDISGNAGVTAARGNVSIKIPGYAHAAVGQGNLSVMMGAGSWPGTLHFSTQRGDIEVWIETKDAFTVHLHTDDGTLFTDFGLRGTSSGTAETIDGSVNGGSAARLDIESSAGTIRLLRLQPQP